MFVMELGVAVAMGWLKKEVIILALRGAWLVLVAALRELSFSSGVLLDSIEVGKYRPHRGKHKFG